MFLLTRMYLLFPLCVVSVSPRALFFKFRHAFTDEIDDGAGTVTEIEEQTQTFTLSFLSSIDSMRSDLEKEKNREVRRS